MSESVACPSIEALEAHLLGPPSAALSAHLLGCAVCRTRADRINDDNALLRGFAIGGVLPAHASVERAVDINIPGYELIREIHAGGQGVVFLARQLSTTRQVAVKVMKQGPFATIADRQRFTREIETLAKLDHPNIIAVHDAGTASGFHYFAMDFVEGVPLDQAVKHAHIWSAATESAPLPSRSSNRLPDATLESILRMFVKICDAVHAAHLRGVMHRDLKPSNILIDSTGEPHVVDFGLAKSTTASPDSAMTRTGQFVGSLPWASPEQVSGDGAHIDLRTDVYSLGAILYQILTGELPFDFGSNLRDAIDNILTREAIRPSVRASATGTHVNDELDTIVLKCLSKDPDRRYQSAGELARDLSRYLAGEPIEAKRDSALYLLRKNLRRYRQSVIIGAAFVVLLTVVSISMTILYRRSTQLEQQATHTAGALAESLSESTINQGRMAGMLGNFEQAERMLWPELLFAPGAHSSAERALLPPPGRIEPYWALWELYRVRPCVQTVLPVPIEYRTFAVVSDGTLWTVDSAGRVAHVDSCGRQIDAWSVNSQPIGGFAVTVDGKYVIQRLRANLSVYRRIAGTSGGEKILELPGRPSAFSTDGTVFAHADGQTVILERVDPRQEIRQWATPGSAMETLTLSGDGRLLAGRSAKAEVLVWSVDDGRELVHTPPRTTRLSPVWTLGDLVFSQDSTHLVDLWLESSGAVLDLRTDPPTFVEFSERPGDGRVACANSDASVVAVGDTRGVVRIFDGATGRRIDSFVAHRRMISGIAMASDGRGIWTAGNGECRLWDRSPSPGVQITSIPGENLFSIAFPRDEKAILTSGTLSRIYCVDRRTRSVAVRDSGAASVVAAIAVEPASGAIAAATYGRSALLWPNGDLDQQPILIHHGEKQSHVAFSPDGGILATTCDDFAVRLWDSRDGHLIRELPRTADRIPQIAFDPAGTRIAEATRDGELRVCQLDTGECATWLSMRGSPLRTVRFSIDGQWLAAGGASRVVLIYDAATGKQVDALVGHNQEIYCLDISADGQFIASGDSGGGLRLWHLPTRRPLASLEGHTDAVMAVKFCDGGNTLVSASLDGTLREWGLRYFDRHIAGQIAAQITRNDASDDSRANLWRTWAETVLARTRSGQ